MKQVLQLAAGLFIAIGLAGCTANEIFDEEMETPSCKAFAEGFSAPETPEATTAADEEAAPDTMPEVARDAVDVTEGCKIWFDGCNQCVVMGGRLRGCTSKVCTTMSEPSCIK